MIKINLGSGTNVLEGWINIDNSWNIYLSKLPAIKKLCYKLRLISEDTFQANWRGKNVKRHDVSKGLPFKSESVDVIYCSHLLEHLRYSQAKKVCKETYRVLKKCGVFRAVVPDLKLYTRKYVEGDRDFFGDSKKPIADLFLESLCMEGLCERSLIEKILYSLHKYMYDAESLTFLLRSAGFNHMRVRSFREGLCPDLERIENRKMSIYIEALK
jgi:predicted SAM-dependent methyltransferase